MTIYIEKTYQNLTVEEKLELLTAIYIEWIMEDAQSENYKFLSDIIQDPSSGTNSVCEENLEMVEQELKEILDVSYNPAKTIKELLEEEDFYFALRLINRPPTEELF